jgi:hypothetical protein
VNFRNRVNGALITSLQPYFIAAEPELEPAVAKKVVRCRARAAFLHARRIFLPGNAALREAM